MIKKDETILSVEESKKLLFEIFEENMKTPEGKSILKKKLDFKQYVEISDEFLEEIKDELLASTEEDNNV